MCLLRINLPNLCPNMIHFDALDFSEWHSEEVISFFWRSVYLSWPVCHEVKGMGINAKQDRCTCAIYSLSQLWRYTSGRHQLWFTENHGGRRKSHVSQIRTGHDHYWKQIQVWVIWQLRKNKFFFRGSYFIKNLLVNRVTFNILLYVFLGIPCSDFVGFGSK